MLRGLMMYIWDQQGSCNITYVYVSDLLPMNVLLHDAHTVHLCALWNTLWNIHWEHNYIFLLEISEKAMINTKRFLCDYKLEKNLKFLDYIGAPKLSCDQGTL